MGNEPREILGKVFKAFIRDLTAWKPGTRMVGVELQIGDLHLPDMEDWVLVVDHPKATMMAVPDPIIPDHAYVKILRGEVYVGTKRLTLFTNHFQLWREGKFANGATHESGEYTVALTVTDANELFMAARLSEPASEEQTFLRAGKVHVAECLRTILYRAGIPGCEIDLSDFYARTSASTNESGQQEPEIIGSIDFPTPMSADAQAALVDSLTKGIITEVSKQLGNHETSFATHGLLKVAVARYVTSRVQK